MGSTDLLKPIIEAASEHFRGWKSTIHFGRVGIKPGKPTTFATLEGPEQKKRVVWGLPGNPASMGVTFWIFVLPTLRKMGGWPAAKCSLPKLSVEVCLF
jgi:gephyrin